MVRPSNPEIPPHSHNGSSRQSGQPVHFILQRRYEVVSHLGQGGMGTVYMARDLRLANRFCVVKKLRDDFFREEDKQKALEFFNREAMVLSPLKHPNIVSITDYFEEAENYYLVMEYIEGENLYQMMNQRGEPFPEEQVLQWAIQIADVLHFLHSNDPKVIYRDLKPSNVMIDTKDRVKLVDFGIARPYAEDSDNTHVVSAGYSPPEQYWGAADPRSDIYALGATMYYLLTGIEPLALQTCVPRKINPNISEHTDLVIQRATAQDVWLRYQTASEMQTDLAYEMPKKSFKMVQIAAVAGAIALIGVGSFLGFKMLTHSASKVSTRSYSSELAEKDEEIKALKLENESREKVLEKLRAYQTKEEEPAQVAQGDATVQTQSLSPTIEKSPKVGVAFREMDEAQLTDPEGLAPLEEGSAKVDSPVNLFNKTN